MFVLLTAHAYCLANAYFYSVSVTNEQSGGGSEDIVAALRLDRLRAAILVKRAWTSLLQEDYDKARTDYTDAIRLDPKNVRAYLGRALCWDDDPHKQDADLAKAFRLDALTASQMLIEVNKNWLEKRKKRIKDLEKELHSKP
jgi:Tfp pilus assembly protein PilF